MVKQSRKIIGILALILFYYCLPLLAKPGNEVLLEEKQFDAVLYVVSVSVSEDSQLKGIQLAWIPESVRDQCIGKHVEECRQFWYEKAAERYKRHLESQQKEDTSKRDLTYSFGTGEKYPPEVLSMWISKADLDPTNKKAFNQLSQLKLIKDILRDNSNGETKLLILEDKKIRAKILYIEFSNGQSFQVIDILDKQF